MRSEEEGFEGCTLKGIESCEFVWEVLWHSDQNYFVELNILDVISLSKRDTEDNRNMETNVHQNILERWLFTSTSSLIKNRQKIRWNFYSVLDRCREQSVQINNNKSSKKLLSHYYNKSSNSWLPINSEDDLKKVIMMCENYPSSIISYSHLNQSNKFPAINSYLEINYEISKNNKKNIGDLNNNKPKISVYLLCDPRSKGIVPSLDYDEDNMNIIPSHKILCQNKITNKLSSEYICNLVKIIESRIGKSTKFISKINILCMLEYINDPGYIPIMSAEEVSISKGLATDDKELRNKKIWLHHVNNIEISPKTGIKKRNKSSESYSDMSYSEYSGFENNSYHSNMKSININEKLGSRCMGDFCFFNSDDPENQVGFGIVDEEIEEFDVKAEVESVVRRHRRIDEDDHFDNLNRKELNSRNASRGFEKQENFDNTNQDGVTKSNNTNEKTEDNSKYIEKHRDINNVLPIKQMKVNMKSILLARKDMQEIEEIEKSLVVPDERLKNSSAVMKANAEKAVLITEICSTNLMRWWCRVGRSMNHNKVGTNVENLNIPISSGHQIGMAVLNANTEASPKKKNNNNKEGLKRIIENNENDENHSLYEVPDRDQTSIGNLSRYYSIERVCERCYSVYTELDHRRNIRQKKQFEKQKELKEQSDHKNEKWKEVEKKIFQQKQLAFRLSQKENKLNNNNNNNNNNNDNKPKYGAAKIVGAPKGALPPLPWNLVNSEQRQVYEKAGNTFAIRNILEKNNNIINPNRSFDKVIEQQWNEVTQFNNNNDDDFKPKITNYNNKNQSKVLLRNGKYDADRLLHPWQRDLQKLKEIANDDSSNSPEKIFNNYNNKSHKSNRNKGVKLKPINEPINVLRESHSADYFNSINNNSNTYNKNSILSKDSNEIPKIISKSSSLSVLSPSNLSNLTLGDDFYDGFDTSDSRLTKPPLYNNSGIKSISSSSKKSHLSQLKSLKVSFDNELDSNINNELLDNSNRPTTSQSSPSKSRGSSRNGSNNNNNNNSFIFNKAPTPIASLSRVSSAIPIVEESYSDDEYDDDDDDEEIGWSPFTVVADE